MNLEHHYAMRLEWTGNRGAGTSDYRSYDRDHVVHASGKPSIEGSRDVGTAVAFNRRVRGRALSFEARGDGFVDSETGTHWDVAGRAVEGELAGERLAPVRHDQQFWFALAAFVPGARIER